MVGRLYLSRSGPGRFTDAPPLQPPGKGVGSSGNTDGGAEPLEMSLRTQRHPATAPGNRRWLALWPTVSPRYAARWLLLVP